MFMILLADFGPIPGTLISSVYGAELISTGKISISLAASIFGSSFRYKRSFSSKTISSILK